MRELYELDLDAFQMSNVQAAPEYADVVAELAHKVSAMRGCAFGSSQQLEED